MTDVTHFVFDAETSAELDAFLAATHAAGHHFDIADHRKAPNSDGEVLLVSYRAENADSLQFEATLRRAHGAFEWKWLVFPDRDLGPKATAFPSGDYGERSGADIALLVRAIASQQTRAVLYRWLGGLYTCIAMDIVSADGRVLHSQGCAWTRLASAQALTFEPW